MSVGHSQMSSISTLIDASSSPAVLLGFFICAVHRPTGPRRPRPRLAAPMTRTPEPPYQVKSAHFITFPSWQRSRRVRLPHPRACADGSRSTPHELLVRSWRTRNKTICSCLKPLESVRFGVASCAGPRGFNRLSKFRTENPCRRWQTPENFYSSFLSTNGGPKSFKRSSKHCSWPRCGLVTSLTPRPAWSH